MIKKRYIAKLFCVVLLLWGGISNSLIGAGPKMPVHKLRSGFWLQKGKYPPYCVKKPPLCYRLAQQRGYTEKRRDYRRPYSGQPRQRPLGIHLAIGATAAGLCLGMASCEAAVEGSEIYLPPLNSSLYISFNDLEKELESKHMSVAEKLIQRWLQTRMNTEDIAYIILKHNLLRSIFGGYQSIDLGILLRYAAKEKAYGVCQLLITYAKVQDRPLSMDFCTFYNPYTPLDYALVSGSYFVARLLLKNGARVVSSDVRAYVRRHNIHLHILLNSCNL